MKKIFRILSTLLVIAFAVSCVSIPALADTVLSVPVKYSTHVSNIGWTNWVNSGETSGKMGTFYEVEAFKIELPEANGLGVKYSAHVENIGWMSPQENGTVAGTEGRCLQTEAIRIELTGENASEYDVWYRTFTDKYGWHGWAKDGEDAGSAGMCLAIQCMQVKICQKGTFLPGTETDAFKTNMITYSTHVSNVGWIENVKDSAQSGIADGNHNIEALRLNLNTQKDLSIKYAAHVSNIGWMSEVPSGNIAGTTGQSLSVEAFYIKLSGADSDKYDIWYTAEIEGLGSLGWAKNGEKCGSEGLALKLYAITVKLCRKGEFVPSNTDAFHNKYVYCKSHVSDIGWQGESYNGALSGTADNYHQIEALKMDIKACGDVSLRYTLHISNIGWTDEYDANTSAGTTGKSYGIEAFRVRLVGNDAGKYDIVYRSYVKNKGWLSWASNYENSGSTGLSLPISGIEIKIVDKGTFDAGCCSVPAELDSFNYSTYNGTFGWDNEHSLGEISGTTHLAPPIQLFKAATNVQNLQINYSAHISNIGWTPYVTDGDELGQTGEYYHFEGIRMNLSGTKAVDYDIWYSTYVDNYGWLGWAKNGEKSGTEGINYSAYMIRIYVCAKNSFRPTNYLPAFTQTPYISAGLVFPTSQPDFTSYLFAIDAGHGGGDSGAIGRDGRYEANDNGKIAEELNRILLQQGQQTYFTDRSVPISERPYSLNQTNAVLCVSLHRDSSTSSAISGISIYTHHPSHFQQTQQPEKDYAPAEYPNKHETDDILVSNIIYYLSQVSSIGFRGAYYGSASAPTWEDYYINRLANMPTCIVEVGFVTSAADNYFFDLEYKRYAKAIAKAMMATVGLTFNEALYTEY